VANHLRPPDRHLARHLGALAVAFGVALLVVAGVGGRAPDNGGTDLVQPATEVSTEPTVLGSTIERSTTRPSAPPASALGFTTTTTDDDSSDDDDGPAPTSQTTTSPTLGPPVSITNTTTTRPTTTTSTSTTTTTTTTEGTTDATVG
jgi:hypothetical protein